MNYSSELPDVKGNIHISIQEPIKPKNLSDIDMKRYSTLSKLLRVTAMLLKIQKYKTFKCNAVDLSSQDIQDALNYWIRYLQYEFCKHWEKRFKRLGAKVDGGGIIIVGARITNWLKKNWDKEGLILLPTQSRFSELVVLAAHNINHDGIDATTARVRKDYWIPQIRKIAKRVRSGCYRCKILDKRQCSQQMGRLPIIERLQPSPPFYYTAVDLFGPIL